MSHASLPILLEDRSRFDWMRAKYEPVVRAGPTSAIVTHCLRAAPSLESLLKDGSAKWATELRCPKTLFCRVDETSESDQRVEWAPEDVDGDLFVIPGLVAASDLTLQTDVGELSPVWPNDSFSVRRGWWLARGLARRTRTLGQSLLKFHEDRKLPNGQMRIQPDSSTENLRFHVQLARDIWPEHTNRHVQVAALIGALARLKDAFASEEDEPAVAHEIRRRLEAAGIPTWDDTDAYDPARAATAIEPFRPSVKPESNG